MLAFKQIQLLNLEMGQIVASSESESGDGAFFSFRCRIREMGGGEKEKGTWAKMNKDQKKP
jgi:hypothetical protein